MWDSPLSKREVVWCCWPAKSREIGKKRYALVSVLLERRIRVETLFTLSQARQDVFWTKFSSYLLVGIKQRTLNQATIKPHIDFAGPKDSVWIEGKVCHLGSFLAVSSRPKMLNPFLLNLVVSGTNRVMALKFYSIIRKWRKPFF